MFCKNCGTQLQDGAAFCPNCGAPVASEGTQNAETQQAQPQPQPQPAPQNAARKSKLAAGLLGIFLGGLGVHNFYLGFTKRALIQLLVSLDLRLRRRSHGDLGSYRGNILSHR